MPFRLKVPSERRWVRPASAVKAILSSALDGQGRPHVAVVEVTLQRGFTKFRVDTPIAFHLDPGQRGFVELSQSQISDSFEHRQQALFDPVPKGFLFAIL